MYTLAPSFPSRSAMARPMPAVAAVTSATLPSRRLHDADEEALMLSFVSAAESSVWADVRNVEANLGVSAQGIVSPHTFDSQPRQHCKWYV